MGLPLGFLVQAFPRSISSGFPFASPGAQRVCGALGEQAPGGFHRLAPEERHKGEPVENTVVKPKREG